MAFIPLDNAVKASIEGTGLNGKPFAHVCYFTTSNIAGWVNAQRVKLAEMITDSLLPGLAFRMSSSYAYTQIVITTMETLPQSQTIFTAGFPIAGDDASPALPGNVVFCVSHTTESIGRSYRGRTYHRGLVESAVTANNLSQAAADDIVGAWDTLMGDLLADGDFRQVIASFESEGVPRVTGVATPVTGHSYTDLVVDTLRKGL